MCVRGRVDDVWECAGLERDDDAGAWLIGRSHGMSWEMDG